MAVLEVLLTNSGSDLEGHAELICTTEYDAQTNQTKVTFVKLFLPGSSLGTVTRESARVTVKAVDNADDEKTATYDAISASLSPAFVTVQHSAEAGEKAVVISMSATTVTGAGPFTGSDSVTVVSGARRGIGYIDNSSEQVQYGGYIEDGTSYSLYAPYVDTGTGWTLEG